MTGNDGCDADSGPNSLQNFPVLSTSVSGAGTGSATSVTGTLTSTASTTFTIDFYANDSCDPSKNGEGKTYLGSTQVTTNGTCVAEIVADLPILATGGQRVTATATNPTGNTSELSECSSATEQFGNLNNDTTLDIFDVITMANFVVGNVTPRVTPFLGTAASADVNRSGAADVFDVVLLQAFLVGNVAVLPT